MFERLRTVAAVPPQPTEVSVPRSEQEARALFGASPRPLPAGGATILTPELASGARRAAHVMLLHRAGLDGVRRDSERMTIGATTRLSALADVPEPLRGAVAGVADPEVRGQATLAGNLCAAPLDGAPRGDLQGPLLALDAVVRWTDGAVDHRDRIGTFLATAAHRTDRLVLAVEFPLPEKGAFAALRRPHSHGYTALAVSAAVLDGDLRLAVTGLGPHALRLHSAEQPLADLAEAVRDDALASSWYRAEMVPVLARRCLEQLGLSA
jgi:carbon-monoxide dehydrogenase medium subunit